MAKKRPRETRKGRTVPLIGGPFDGDTISYRGKGDPVSMRLVEEKSGRIVTYQWDEQRSAFACVGYQDEAGNPQGEH